MAYLILYDPEANIAALVDPDSPAALGPIAIGDPGDDPCLALREFVDGLNAPPETMPTWVLFNEWQAYVRAIVQMVEDEVSAAAESEPPAQEGDSTPQATQAPPAAGDEASAAAEAPGLPEPSAPAEGDADAPDPELSDRIQDAPGTPAKAGQLECWLCHGDLEIDSPQGRQVCPVCKGEGRVSAETQPAG